MVHSHHTPPTKWAVMRAGWLIASTVDTVFLVLLNDLVLNCVWDGFILATLIFDNTSTRFCFLVWWNVCVNIFDLNGLGLVLDHWLTRLVLYVCWHYRSLRFSWIRNVCVYISARVWTDYLFKIEGQLLHIVSIVDGDKTRISAHAIGVWPKHEGP